MLSLDGMEPSENGTFNPHTPDTENYPIQDRPGFETHLRRGFSLMTAFAQIYATIDGLAAESYKRHNEAVQESVIQIAVQKARLLAQAGFTSMAEKWQRRADWVAKA